MKVADILELYERGLTRLDESGADIRDIRYVGLFREYVSQTARGAKKGYVIAKLAEKHGISFRKAYRIVKRLNKEI